jgi:multidrug resistance efflux pump
MTPIEAIESSLEKLNVARADIEPYKYLDAKSVNYAEPRADTSEMSPEELEIHLALLEQHKYDERPVTGEARIKKKALDEAWQLYRVAIRWLELESNFQNAQVRLTHAQKDYNVLQGNSSPLDTAALRATLANAELRAPHSGVITELKIKVGEYVSANTPVVTIADTSKWLVKTSDLTELNVVKIKGGQPVTVMLDALPGKEFKGNILTIGHNFSENQGDVVYEITILLTEFDPAMRWGMTAEVKFK